jgi:hypothetical protein
MSGTLSFARMIADEISLALRKSGRRFLNRLSHHRFHQLFSFKNLRVEPRTPQMLVQKYLQKFKKKEMTGEEVMIQLSNDIDARNDRLRKIYKWNYE